MGRSSHVSILFHGLGVGHRAIGLRDGPYRGGHVAITRLGSLEVVDGLRRALGFRSDGESSGCFSSSGPGALGDMAVAAPLRNSRPADPSIFTDLRCGNNALDRSQLCGVPQIYPIPFEFRARALA